METNAKVPPVQPAPESPQTQTQPQATPPQEQQDLAAAPGVPAYISDPADYRLVIEKDPVSGTYVYKTVDRMTGQTVTQLPNEEIVRLRDSASYKAGAVFDGKA